MKDSQGQGALSQACLDSMDGRAGRRVVLRAEEGLVQRSWGKLRSALKSDPRGAGEGARPARSPPSGPPRGQGATGLCPQDNSRPSRA